MGAKHLVPHTAQGEMCVRPQYASHLCREIQEGATNSIVRSDIGVAVSFLSFIRISPRQRVAAFKRAVSPMLQSLLKSPSG